MQLHFRSIRSNGATKQPAMKIETICKRTKHLTMDDAGEGRGILLCTCPAIRMTGQPSQDPPAFQRRSW